MTLLACGKPSSTRGDGPPRRAADLSNIKDAVPKHERQTRAGNPSTYVVFGKRYYVMRKNKGYVRRGVASWYGSKFHGRPTSNGERYNMYEMTAAHKTLRIPTYVRVRNLENNKVIIVRVNDRGPFVGNRIIDLSYAAAHKIGMLGKGTAFVQVEIVRPGETDLPMLANEAKKQSPLSIDAPKIEKSLPLVSRIPSFKTARSIESQRPNNNAPSRTPEQRQKEYNLRPLAKLKFKIIPEPKINNLIRSSGPVRVSNKYPKKYRGGLAKSAHQKKSSKSRLKAYIQIGAFRKRSHAKRLYAKLWKLSYPHLSIHRTIHRGRPLYRVRIGPLLTVTQLDQISNDLSKNGFKLIRIIVK